MSTAATQLGNLSATQRELLANLLNAKRLSETDSIPKQPRDRGLPLSFAQQRMWFLAQLEPENPNYNIAGAIEIIGELNVPLLEKSINEVVRRHEVLRSVFKSEGQQTEQRALNERHVGLSRLDFSHLSPEDYQLTQSALLTEELSKPFELLVGGDLLRVSLLSSEPLKHCLLLTMHHIVSDEWSLRLLIKEIGQIYTAFAQGGEPHLPVLPIQYADYATWQRSKFSGEQRDKLLNYWTNLLGGAPALLDLPCDYSRPPKPSYRGGSHSMLLPKSLADGVVQFSKAHGMTPFMTLIGVFAMLLHRYAASGDVCIGYPTTNRHKPELEGLIGFFVNTLVFRSRLGGDVELGAYFARVRQSLLDGQKYKDLPFEQLVEALNPQRDMRYHPVFQVMFSYQDRAFDLPDMPGLTFRLPAVESVSAKFDLILQVGQSAAGFDCQFEYSSDLFALSSIARLAEHFKILLTQVVEQPNCRLSQLQLLLGDERRKIVFDWNSTAGDYPKDWCLQDLFEAQVEKTPHAIALSVADSNLSYAELNAKANQLAHYLIERGVRPDSPVGICLERSPEMVIALLGVLKAGAAYLPLDPHYPEERLRYMLEDAGVGLVLTRLGEARLLDEGRRQVIYLDQAWAEIAQALADKPYLRCHPLNLAYLIYTSGSTGRPKGVAVTHGNAVHSTWARFQTYSDSVEAYLLLSSFAFDSSVAGIFWTLGQGGCLCLPDNEAGKDPAALSILIERHRISHLLALPSLYGLLLEQPSESLRCLKVAIVAGEACATEVVKRHFNVLPGVKLYNEYGPTEATVWSSVYQAGLEDLCRTLAIGRPIANVRLYILDPYLNPVPVGVAGELYIGGAGIVRGYLDRPGLSAERFIPDIFHGDGARLYRTGDLVRYRDDGTIEFLGRFDQQVKIRGFRIELGEIEAQLLKQPGVREVVVLAREDRPSDKRLVAYWVEDSLGSLSCEALKAELKQTLPDFMLPSAFVLLDKLPLGANGKVDRKRLPAPDISEQLGKQYLAPRNETEATLVGIWQEVLGVEKVGVEDDFFELGGHSLLATQLASRVAKRFAIDLPLRSVFEAGNVATLGEKIDLLLWATRPEAVETGSLNETDFEEIEF